MVLSNRKILVIGIIYSTQLMYSLIALMSYIEILLTLISFIGYLLLCVDEARKMFSFQMSKCRCAITMPDLKF